MTKEYKKYLKNISTELTQQKIILREIRRQERARKFVKKVK